MEGGEISEEEATEPAPVAVVEEEQPKRGGRRKLALTEVEEETAEEVNVEAPVKKRGRKKALAAIEEVAVAPSPVKRGRRGAAPVEEKEEEVKEKEVKEKSPVRRGRKAAVENIVAEEARYGNNRQKISVLNFVLMQHCCCEFSREEGQKDHCEASAC